MKRDIRDRQDILLVLDFFYDKLLKDPLMSPFFTSINLEQHLDILCDFWENALFQAGKYNGDMLGIHMEVNSVRKIEHQHFDQWLEHFKSSVTALHEGEVASLALNKARTLATIIRAKIDEIEKLRLELNN